MREIQGIARVARLSSMPESRPLQRFQGRYGGISLALAVTGVGKSNAEDSMARLSHHIHPAAIVSLGFAGGLAEDLPSGDLAIASRIMATPKGKGYLEPDPMLLDLSLQVAHELGTDLHVCPFLTSPEPALTPAVKEALGRQYGASVIDMESYWIGNAATSLGVPFMALRVILDPLRQSLPKVVENLMTRSGGRLALTTFRRLLSRPQDGIALLRLARESGLAERHMRQLVMPLVTRLGQELHTPART
ncbi:MAG: hypothetical protein HYX93_06870 [Chloroflexi bacterium]|nr:hypothetical protein [Chloroflexota bacterium]